MMPIIVEFVLALFLPAEPGALPMGLSWSDDYNDYLETAQEFAEVEDLGYGLEELFSDAYPDGDPQYWGVSSRFETDPAVWVEVFGNGNGLSIIRLSSDLTEEEMGSLAQGILELYPDYDVSFSDHQGELLYEWVWFDGPDKRVLIHGATDDEQEYRANVFFALYERYEETLDAFEDHIANVISPRALIEF